MWWSLMLFAGLIGVYILSLCLAVYDHEAREAQLKAQREEQQEARDADAPARRRARRSSLSVSRRGPVILSVEGIIGAGKSTLLRRVQQVFGPRLRIVPECVDLWRALPEQPTAFDPPGAGTGLAAPTHNILELYYRHPDQYAVPFQVFTLATRTRVLRDALREVAEDPRVEVVLIERSIGGDACFAAMLHADGKIDPAWYAAYNYMRSLYTEFLPDVDGIINLNVRPPTAMMRLHMRARGEEVGVTESYQQRLYDTIRRWVELERRPVLSLQPADYAELPTSDLQAERLAHRIHTFASAVRNGKAD